MPLKLSTTASPSEIDKQIETQLSQQGGQRGGQPQGGFVKLLTRMIFQGATSTPDTADEAAREVIQEAKLASGTAPRDVGYQKRWGPRAIAPPIERPVNLGAPGLFSGTQAPGSYNITAPSQAPIPSAPMISGNQMAIGAVAAIGVIAVVIAVRAYINKNKTASGDVEIPDDIVQAVVEGAEGAALGDNNQIAIAVDRIQGSQFPVFGEATRPRSNSAPNPEGELPTLPRERAMSSFFGGRRRTKRKRVTRKTRKLL